MPLRTVIEGTADGQVKITRETRVGISGNAQQRKKKIKAGVQETWRVMDRVICPSLTMLPKKAQDWPIAKQVTADKDENAADRISNDLLAQLHVELAARKAAAIDKQNAEFSMPEPKKLRVMLVEEE